MSFSNFFQHIMNPKPTEHNIIKDILRLIRDVLSIVNSFLLLPVINDYIDTLNDLLHENPKGFFNFTIN